MIYFSEEHCVLDLSFEYCEAVCDPLLRLWTRSYSISSRDAFFTHVHKFNELLSDSYHSRVAILPYADQNYSMQFDQGYFDPIYTSQDLRKYLQQAHQIYEQIVEGGDDDNEKLRYAWNTHWAIINNPCLWKPRVMTNKIRARWKELVKRYDGPNGGEASVKFCFKYSKTSPQVVFGHLHEIGESLMARTNFLGWFAFCRHELPQLMEQLDSNDEKDEEFQIITTP